MQKHSLRELKGIGEKTERLFQKLNIDSIEDLLQYYPRNYDVYEPPVSITQIRPGKIQTVEGVIVRSASIKKVRNLSIVTTTIAGEGGQLSLVWFHMPFLCSTLKKGYRFLFRGKVIVHDGMMEMEQPKIYTLVQYEPLLHTMQPLYGLTAGLTNQTVVKAVRQALEYKKLCRDWLEEDRKKRYCLADYNYALETIHFPANMREYKIARRRLAFDEFFFFLFTVQRLKAKTQVQENAYPMKCVWETEKIMESLPYTLTNAQLRAWTEIETDLQKNRLMSRLIQGDVGSGKTILAFLAMIMAAKNGYQAALMAPTEVLATQHYGDLLTLLQQQNMEFCQPVLLTGSVKTKERREIYAKIADGTANLIVGTHALIQEKVSYNKLALVITDEQHRFGVKQREAFSGQKEPANVMVMSATPIPRTLAIILYGDLDISVIDELPAKRLPIKNCVVDTRYRKKSWEFIRKEVQSGHQAYVICPMVEASEEMEGENVLDYSRQLQEYFGDALHVEFLHGKMKPSQKDEIMTSFSKGDIQVLVSTTVVEVGVNVPNATVMMVENADRFGLAQLHQLRGRVGRGDAQSYCIFVQGTEGEDTKKRLEILNQSNDGFFIAGEDLKLRGPGDLFGVRQSGLMEFKIGDIYQDADVLKAASEAVSEILKLDEKLELSQHEQLKERIEYYGRDGLENISI